MLKDLPRNKYSRSAAGVYKVSSGFSPAMEIPLIFDINVEAETIKKRALPFFISFIILIALLF